MNESIWISELVSEIGDRIADKFDISRDQVDVNGEPIVRRFSVTQQYLVRTTGKQKLLIAKTRRFASKSAFADSVLEPRTRQLAEREYETHQKAIEIFSQHESLSVPILYDLHRDLATIVMELVDGKSLARSISFLRSTNKGHRGQNLGLDFANAGVWLKTFHQGIAEPDQTKWRRDSIDGIVADHLESLRKDGLDQRKFDNLKVLFDQHFTEVDDRMTQIIGKIHGDFKPAHVMIGDRQLAVIDFGTTRLEYGAFDVGSFLADLFCNGYGPRLVRQARIDQLAAAFLQGYHGTNSPNPVVNLYCCTNLLRLWRKRRQRFPNGTLMRNVDKALDLSKCRGLFNRAYVDRWFEKTITKVLGNSRSK